MKVRLKNFQEVVCLSCSGLHFVNPKTGKVLGQEDK